MSQKKRAGPEATELLRQYVDAQGTAMRGISRGIKTYRESLEQTRTAMEPHLEAMRTLAEHARNWIAQANSILAEVDPAVWAFFAELTSYKAFEDALEPTGCLPHWSIRDTELAEMVAAHRPRAAANGWLRENWSRIEERLASRIEGYAIDDVSRRVFKDALRLQGMGMHLIAVRGLFPEMERVFRQKFVLPAGSPRTSLKEFRKAALEAPYDVVYQYSPTAKLIEVLDEHLYSDATSDAQLSRLASHPVPNRHAALHGRIDYCEPVHGFNALVMADLVFHLAGVLEPAEQTD